MHTIFFHVRQSAERDDDKVGTELAGRTAAIEEATKMCGAMIAEIDGELVNFRDWHLDVDDEAGPLSTIKVDARYMR